MAPSRRPTAQPSGRVLPFPGTGTPARVPEAPPEAPRDVREPTLEIATFVGRQLLGRVREEPRRR